MTLVKRALPELEWPTWMTTRGLFDIPDSWVDSLGEVAIRVEEFEEDGHLFVRADVPGVNPDEDIEISMTDGMLRISVQRKKETKHEGKRHYRSEFQYGSFVRTVALPAGCSDSDVKAEYVDGVLEVRIPMSSKESKSKKISIQKR
jgi:HSP20 family protein